MFAMNRLYNKLVSSILAKNIYDDISVVCENTDGGITWWILLVILLIKGELDKVDVK